MRKSDLVAQNMIMSSCEILAQISSRESKEAAISLIDYLKGIIGDKKSNSFYYVKSKKISDNLNIYANLLNYFVTTNGVCDLTFDDGKSHEKFTAFLKLMNKKLITKKLTDRRIVKFSDEQLIQMASKFFTEFNSEYGMVIQHIIKNYHNKGSVYFFADHSVRTSMFFNELLSVPIVKLQNGNAADTLIKLIHEMMHQINYLIDLERNHMLSESSAIYAEMIAHLHVGFEPHIGDSIHDVINERIKSTKMLVSEFLKYEKLFNYCLNNNVPLTEESIDKYRNEDIKFRKIIDELAGYTMENMVNYVVSYAIAKYYQQLYLKDPAKATLEISFVSKGCYIADLDGFNCSNPRTSIRYEDDNKMLKLNLEEIFEIAPNAPHTYTYIKNN